MARSERGGVYPQRAAVMGSTRQGILTGPSAPGRLPGQRSDDRSGGTGTPGVRGRVIDDSDERDAACSCDDPDSLPIVAGTDQLRPPVAEVDAHSSVTFLDRHRTPAVGVVDHAHYLILKPSA